MAEVIGEQDGIQALRQGLVSKGVLGTAGAANVERTLEQLKTGHNELVQGRALDRLAALEGQLDQLPFLRPPAAT